MNRETLLKKWLDNNLSPSELKKFKALDESSLAEEIALEAKRFNLVENNNDESYNRLIKKRGDTTFKEVNKVRTLNFTKTVLPIAAILVVCLALYFSFFNVTTNTIITNVAEQKIEILPDKSTVLLNAASKITYQPKQWNSDRNVNLEGEAYFKVSKGESFTVKTEIGDIKVLGTQFNVRQREKKFEVSCFEGLVEVFFKGKNTKLPAGTFLRIKNDIIFKATIKETEPSWKNNLTNFNNAELIFVLDELKRQYPIEIITDIENINAPFSGTFENTNLENALNAITIPMGLDYKIKSNSVKIYDATKD